MTKLMAIKLKDFQSWANGTIEFAPGLNVICGENNHGKSAIFNALMITCNPDKFSSSERQDFIRHTKKYAEISYIFEGYQAGVVRLLSNRIIYMFSEDFRNKPYKQSEGKPPKELLELLEVYVEPTTGFLLNIIDSDRQLLLVNSDEKADSQLITSLIQSQDLARLIRVFESKIPDLESYNASVLASQYRTEAKLAKLEYTDINNLESSIEQAELLLSVFPNLIRIYDYIKDIEFIAEDFNYLNDILDMIALIEEIESTGLLSININDDDFDVNALDICNLGLMLESTGLLNIDDTISNDMSVEQKILDTTSLLADVYNRISNVESLIKGNIELSSNIINPLEKITNDLEPLLMLNDIILEIDNIVQIQTSTHNKVTELEEIIKRLVNENEVLNCPIYSNIVFKDNACIPVIK